MWAEEPETPEELYARKEAVECSPICSVDFTIIAMRDDGCSCREVSEVVGLSIERVRQMERRARTRMGCNPHTPLAIAAMRRAFHAGESIYTVAVRAGITVSKARDVIGSVRSERFA